MRQIITKSSKALICWPNTVLSPFSRLTCSIFTVTPSFFKESKYYSHSLCLNEKARLRETKVLSTVKAHPRQRGPESPTQSQAHAPGRAPPPRDCSGDPARGPEHGKGSAGQAEGPPPPPSPGPGSDIVLSFFLLSRDKLNSTLCLRKITLKQRGVWIEGHKIWRDFSFHKNIFINNPSHTYTPHTKLT